MTYRCCICNEILGPGSEFHKCDPVEVIYKLRGEIERLKEDLYKVTKTGEDWMRFAYWLANEDFEQAWSEYMNNVKEEND